MLLLFLFFIFYTIQCIYILIGGKISEDILNQKKTVAVHTTCFEQDMKIKGLKVISPYICVKDVILCIMK